MSLLKKITISILLVRHGVNGATSGSQAISTHYYEDQAKDLDTNPTFCGMKGSDLDLSRVTAVASLTQGECGSCLQISSGSNSVYAMAVDKGGQGLDLNKSQFQSLSGSDTGSVDASWSATSSSNCAGIVKGGNNALPGLDRTSGESSAPNPAPQQNNPNAAQPNVPGTPQNNQAQQNQGQQNNQQENQFSNSQNLQQPGQLGQQSSQQLQNNALNQQYIPQTNSQSNQKLGMKNAQQSEIENTQQQLGMENTQQQGITSTQQSGLENIQQPGIVNNQQSGMVDTQQLNSFY